MDKYWTSDGMNVYDFNTCIEALTSRFNDQLERLEFLEEENKKLKDAAYKDIEMKKMKEQLEKMSEEYHRGFPITEGELKMADDWIKKHDAEAHGAVTNSQRLRRGGCCGGNYSYEFVPTSIGVIGYVKCSCGEKSIFADI